MKLFSCIDLLLDTILGATPSHPAFGNAKTVEGHLTIESATETIKSWLAACEQTHPLCREPLFKLPHRVLNVAGELPKLVETNGSTNGKYITLSHCWGQDPHIRPTMTTLSNVKNRKEGIPLEELCTLFKDFIDLARRLECEFVWIDSLCIIQDDHEDWIKESGKMGNVYSNALFNIAATSLPDSSHGLFVERRAPRFSDYVTGPLCLYTLKFTADSSHTVSIRASHQSDHEFLFDGRTNLRLEQAPLLTRAWVLQERLLARRSINFCGSELVWECRSSCTCECMGMDSHLDYQSQDPAVLLGDKRAASASGEQSPSLKQLFSQLHQGTLSPQQAYTFWLHLVAEYSAMQLSKPKDRYHALTGITDTFSKIVKDKCLAGIWESDMARGLFWQGTIRSSRIPYSRSSIAPTWSWMSRFSRRRGQFGSDCDYRPVIDTFLRDKRLVINHSTPGAYLSFGPCKDTILDITAAVIPARISINTPWSSPVIYSISLQQPTWTKQQYMSADCPGLTRDNLRDGDECLCLLLGRTYDTFYDCVIVLRKCLGSKAGFFNRIGAMPFKWHKHSPFENAEVRRLLVI